MKARAAISVSIVIMSTSLSISPRASAQDYARSGFYVGAGVVGGSYTELEEEAEDVLPVSVDVDTAVGFEVYGGYRFHPNFAVEAEFEMLPETDIDASGFGDFAEIESWTLTGNVKVFPLTGRIQPFLLVGLGVMDAELEDTIGLGASEDETGFAARFGGGLDVYITENIAVSAGVDYVLPSGDDILDEADYVSYGGGALIRF
jgi:opacity protein-like surface antigen